MCACGLEGRGDRDGIRVAVSVTVGILGAQIKSYQDSFFVCFVFFKDS